jgi:hypothetical protein
VPLRSLMNSRRRIPASRLRTSHRIGKIQSPERGD